MAPQRRERWTTYAVQEDISRPRRSIRSRYCSPEPGCLGPLQLPGQSQDKTEGAYHPHTRNQCCKFCHAHAHRSASQSHHRGQGWAGGGSVMDQARPGSNLFSRSSGRASRQWLSSDRVVVGWPFRASSWWPPQASTVLTPFRQASPCSLGPWAPCPCSNLVGGTWRAARIASANFVTVRGPRFPPVVG